jgi:hypothetical protein
MDEEDWADDDMCDEMKTRGIFGALRRVTVAMNAPKRTAVARFVGQSFRNSFGVGLSGFGVPFITATADHG